MIVIDKDNRIGLTVDAIGVSFNGVYFLDFRKHDLDENNLSKSSHTCMLLPDRSIEPLITKLEQANQIMQEALSLPQFPRILDDEPSLIALDYETGFIVKVSPHIKRVEFHLQQLINEKWTDFWQQGLTIHTGVIPHIILKLQEELHYVEFMAVYDHDRWMQAWKNSNSEIKEKVVSQTEEDIRYFLRTRPQDKHSIRNFIQTRLAKGGIEFFYEDIYASAIKNLTDNGEISWNEKFDKFELTRLRSEDT